MLFLIPLVSGIISGEPDHLIRKILGILSKFGLITYSIPVGSVEGRLEQLYRALRLILYSHGVPDPSQQRLSVGFFWGHQDFTIYEPFDSQHLCFAVNFGLIAALAFAALNFFFLYKALAVRPSYRAFLFASLLVFNIGFFINRLLDYFPMGFFYVLILVAILKHQDTDKKVLLPSGKLGAKA